MDADLFLHVAERAEDLIAEAAVAECWDEPSALEGYTVGGLAGHLARAVLTVQRYLDTAADDARARAADVGPAGPDPRRADRREPDVRVTDAAGYLVAVLGSHDPVQSAFHQAVRRRGAEEARQGPAELVERLRAARTELAPRLAASDAFRRVMVLEQTVMGLRDYLDTRLVELVVHHDDLRVSVGADTSATLPPEAYERVACVLATVAARRVSGIEVVRSLSRAERHPEAVRAL